MSDILQSLTIEELHHLIGTLEDDLANRPAPPEFEIDEVREFMVATMSRARARLDLLTSEANP